MDDDILQVYATGLKGSPVWRQHLNASTRFRRGAMAYPAAPDIVQGTGLVRHLWLHAATTLASALDLSLDPHFFQGLDELTGVVLASPPQGDLPDQLLVVFGVQVGWIVPAGRDSAVGCRNCCPTAAWLAL